MKIPITQSEAWAKLQADLHETHDFITGKSYQFLAITKHTPAGNYLYCPYGPVAQDEASLKESLHALKELAKQKNAVFIRVEPQLENATKYLPSSAKKSKDLNPKETWLLDLTGNDDDLKAKLPSRLLRYHKSAPKKGITIETSHNPDDIHYLLDLQKALAAEKGISTFSENYLKTELSQPFATLYLVRSNNGEHGGVTDLEGDPKMFAKQNFGEGEGPAGPHQSQVIAAGLVFDDETTRYNLQGAQSDEGRKLHATGILTIQLIKDAKDKGLNVFDFWGIAPEGAGPDHPWAGFTNFKKTFAGYEKDYAGTYDLVLKPAKYKLYQSTRKLNRLIRRKA